MIRKTNSFATYTEIIRCVMQREPQLQGFIELRRVVTENTEARLKRHF